MAYISYSKAVELSGPSTKGLLLFVLQYSDLWTLTLASLSVILTDIKILIDKENDTEIF